MSCPFCSESCGPDADEVDAHLASCPAYAAYLALPRSAPLFKVLVGDGSQHEYVYVGLSGTVARATFDRVARQDRLGIVLFQGPLEVAHYTTSGGVSARGTRRAPPVSVKHRVVASTPAPADPHANCRYAGTCVAYLIDPHVSPCKP